jgi:RNase P/RNase MRP subunit p30
MICPHFKITCRCKLLAEATARPCHAAVVSATATNGASEDYAFWISGRFPRSIIVDRGTYIVASDMRLIAALANSAEALVALVRAARGFDKALDFEATAHGSYEIATTHWLNRQKHTLNYAKPLPRFRSSGGRRGNDVSAL